MITCLTRNSFRVLRVDSRYFLTDSQVTNRQCNRCMISIKLSTYEEQFVYLAMPKRTIDLTNSNSMKKVRKGMCAKCFESRYGRDKLEQFLRIPNVLVNN